MTHLMEVRETTVSFCKELFSRTTSIEDVLFDARTHLAKKLVLHTNYPGHYNFNMYMRCEFSLRLNKTEINAYSRWDDLKKHFSHIQRPIVLHRAGSTNTTNPFGGTQCYGYEDIIFEEENRGNVKEKAKGFTPISAKTLYKNGSSSTTEISKYIGNKSNFLNDSMSLFAKSTSLKGPVPLKSVSVDYREKEARFLEREREAKRQEQAKQAATAEKKKRYEEKIEKKKEAIEKEKLKAQEMQRLKEERYKLLLQQKEEKQKQLREENEKKRLLAKQRAEEKRKEEEYQRMLAYQEKLKNEQLMKKKAEAEDLRKKALQSSTTPIYMTKPAPYLQCADCYDSDDEEYSSKRMIPDWASKHRKFEVDKIQTTLGHKIKNTFFSCQNHTVDLRDVFIQIDPRKLKRTSSANWKKPPRFTMLPDCQ